MSGESTEGRGEDFIERIRAEHSELADNIIGRVRRRDDPTQN